MYYCQKQQACKDDPHKAEEYLRDPLAKNFKQDIIDNILKPYHPFESHTQSMLNRSHNVQ